MSGKRFVSPGSAMVRDRPKRTGGAGAPRASPPASFSPHTAVAVPAQRRHPSAAWERHHTTSPMASLGPPSFTPLSASISRTGRGVSTGNVHSMLSDLVQLSQSIATYLEQEPALLADAHPTRADGGASRDGNGGRELATLRAQEIERIVNRVQAHFKAKMDSLERENASLRQQLSEARASRADRGPPSGVRRGIAAQEDALNELGKVWASADGAISTDVDQLRSVLLAEKRQRLLVEEQTQSLTEQHAKVVSTLERRLKKQEEQLRDLIHAVDKSYNAPATASASRSPGPSSPAAGSSSVSLTGGQVTPRRLLRQQLAQHQQTQRALEQYRQRIAPDEGLTREPHGTEANTHGLDNDDGDTDLLGLADVQATLQAIQRSTPPTVVAAPATRAADPPPPPNGAGPRTGGPAAEDVRGAPRQPGKSTSQQGANTTVDEIGAYLDSIAKELENLGADDDLL